MPPGPPVMSPLVAEIYGPDEAESRVLAQRLERAMGSGAERVDMEGAMLKADPEVAAALPAAQIEGAFDLGYHFKHVDTIFARVFGD